MQAAADTLLDERAASRLQWRCRRGMLENDLFVERFFRRQRQRVTLRQARALHVLMELPDNDLLDLLLRRCELHGALDRPDVRELLQLMRTPEIEADRIPFNPAGGTAP